MGRSRITPARCRRSQAVRVLPQVPLFIELFSRALENVERRWFAHEIHETHESNKKRTK